MKKYIIGILLSSSIFTVKVNAQAGSVSPYSYFGLGLTESFNNVKYYSMGQTGYALGDYNFLNSKNPASLTNLSPSLSVLDIGAYASKSTSEYQNNSESRLDGNITNVGLGFRINDHFYTSVGLEPVSKSRYKINMSVPLEGSEESYPVTVNGKGGLNKFYGNLAYKLNDNFSFGGSIGYYFGTVEQDQFAYVGSSTIDVLHIDYNNSHKGIGGGLGFQYKQKINRNLNATLGGVFNFKTSLDINQTRTVTKIKNTIANSTVVDEFSHSGNLPVEFGAGIAVDWKEEWTFAFDYTMKKYDGYHYISNNSEVYHNENIFNLGSQYTPRINSLSGFFNKLQYRGGVSYSTGNFSVDETKIDHLGVNVGVGIPLGNLGSFLNLGYSYGSRGQLNNASVKDTYHTFTISVNYVDRWFQKRTYR